MNREGKLLRWVMAAVAVSILATTFVMYWKGAPALEAHRHVREHQETAEFLDALLLSVTELELGYRGYLLTGSPDGLLPYRSIRQKLGSHLSHLGELASSGKLPVQEVKKLSALVEEKLAETRPSQANSGLATANEAALDGRGEQGMQAIRELIAKLRGDQALRVTQALEDLRKGATERTLFLIVGAIFSLILLTWGFQRLRSESVGRTGAMQELDRKNHLWASVLASIDDAVVVADKDGAVTFMNREAERLTGWEGREAAGQPLENVFRAVDERNREPAPLSIVSGGAAPPPRAGSASGPLLLVSKTGQEFPVAATVAPLGKATAEDGVVISFRDLTTQRLSEMWLRTVFDSTYDAILIHDIDGRILDFNIKALELYGVTPKDFEFLSILDLSAPGVSHQEAKNMWARVMAGDRRFFEWKALRPYDRKQFDVEVFLRKVPFPGRDAIMANIRDITQRKQSERELRDQEAQLRTISESLPQLVWTATAESGCDYVNRQWMNYTGAPESEVLGFGWLKFVHPDDVERARAAWVRAIERGKTFEAEYRLLRRDHVYREFMVRAVPVTDDEGQVTRWFGTCTDIAELAQARRALANSRVELEATVQDRTARLQQTVAELESFTYSLSHDMRAPLRTMRSFAQILTADYGQRLDEEAREHLTRIEQAAGRLDQLIQDMLNYSRVLSEHPELEEVNCETLIRSIIAERAFLQPPRANVVIAGPLPPVRAHAATLAQCLFNILENAAKFVKPGSPCHIVVQSERLQTSVRLWIKDNGIGIPADLLDKVFGVFQRLHREDEYPGTGIGLAIVRKAVERMGGKVGVESRPGEGSRFWLELPGAQEQQHEAEQHSTR